MCSTDVRSMCTLNITCVRYSEKVFGMKLHYMSTHSKL
jgi:hypothetical protein